MGIDSALKQYKIDLYLMNALLFPVNEVKKSTKRNEIRNVEQTDNDQIFFL